jgi:uncharacterized membrane protein YccC
VSPENRSAAVFVGVGLVVGVLAALVLRTINPDASDGVLIAVAVGVVAVAGLTQWVYSRRDGGSGGSDLNAMRDALDK